MSGFNFNSKSNACAMLADISYVFYVNASGNLAYLWFQGPEQAPGAVAPYKSNTIMAQGQDGVNPVTVGLQLPQITACSWKDSSGQYHLRVYYIAPDSNYLRELCMDTKDPNTGGVWTRGKLNESLSVIADPEAQLTALVSVGGPVDQLKVYFKAKAPDRFYVAYANPGSTNWASREAFNKGNE